MFLFDFLTKMAENIVLVNFKFFGVLYNFLTSVHFDRALI